MTSKQRAYLRSLATNLEPVVQIGKSTLTPEIVEAVREAIEKRELIKLSILKSCEEDPMTMADMVAERTRSQVVQVIGRKIVLYKQAKAKENRKIVLP